MQNLIQTVFVCDINALNAEQKRRYPEVLEQLQMSVQEVKELPDGYAYRHVTNAETLLLIGEFIALERLCCPFLDFTLVAEHECLPMWLKLTGPEGVKQFLRAEMELDRDDKENH
jgi:hypothetical protein